jgi:hypothetical protein
VRVRVESWEKFLNTKHSDGEILLMMQYIVSLYQGTCGFVTMFLDVEREEVVIYINQYQSITSIIETRLTVSQNRTRWTQIP